jgi:hypothetical protein
MSDNIQNSNSETSENKDTTKKKIIPSRHIICPHCNEKFKWNYLINKKTEKIADPSLPKEERIKIYQMNYYKRKSAESKKVCLI